MYEDYEVKKISSYKDLLKIMLEEHDGTAFVCSDRAWSYRDFSNGILSLVSGISKLEKKKIRINLKNDFHFVSAYIATVLSGKIAVLSENELPLDERTDTINDDNYQMLISDGLCKFEDLPDLDTDQVCTILHSSGTSSAPKGIMLSQNNICTDVVCGLQKYLMKRDDRFIHLIPYYHAFGIVCDMLGPLLVGAKIYILEDKKQFLAQMSQIKPTILNVPPVIADALLNLIRKVGDPQKITGGCLKKMLCGGAGLSAQTAKGLREHGIFAYGCYGLSECSPCVAVNRDEFYKDGSAGVPLNCNKIIIANDGEILISGSNVMVGYYEDEEATQKVIIEGVLHTGDLGYLDEDGFLFVTGRKSNLIVFSDGTKCSPEILEAQIISNTFAEEVIICRSSQEQRATLDAIIYLPDMTKQTDVQKYISAELRQYKFDHITFSDVPLPKSATGKIRRT